MVFETGEKLSFNSEQNVQIDLLKKYNNNKIILGIRPEFVSIALNDNSNNLLQGRIKLIEPLGNETLYHFEFGSTEIICRQRYDENISNTICEIIKLSLDLNNVSFFHINSNKNLSV